MIHTRVSLSSAQRRQNPPWGWQRDQENPHISKYSSISKEVLAWSSRTKVSLGCVRFHSLEKVEWVPPKKPAGTHFNRATYKLSESEHSSGLLRPQVSHLIMRVEIHIWMFFTNGRWYKSSLDTIWLCLHRQRWARSWLFWPSWWFVFAQTDVLWTLGNRNVSNCIFNGLRDVARKSVKRSLVFRGISFGHQMLCARS